jgi:hypothetical protein
MDRHLRIAMLVCLPLAAVLGTLASHWNWSTGLVYAGAAVIAALGSLILTRGMLGPRRR